MDPNNLDPKLKETYDRVMGTQTTPQAAQNPATPASPTAPAPAQVATPLSPTPPPATPIAPIDTSPSMPTPAYTQDNLNFQAAIQTPVIGAPMSAQGAVIPQKQTPALLKILYIIGAIVFFVAYTYLWIKIFNIPLPF